ncbi:MAG: bifunctional 4-hydroxy-2-oxoglutarate aldolase/2-dehydro-3-deoxy-phosphogluconate aldolase [Chitinophagaceae bacterium]
MTKKEDLIKLIPEQGVLPLFFHKDPEVSKNVIKNLYEGGIRTIEYTNRGAEALENFKILRKFCDNELPGMHLGSGTIKTKEAAEVFVNAGTDFIVSPGLVKDVAKVAEANKLLWIPGCMTPSEIIKAEGLGAKMIKLFPGDLLGPRFVSAIRPIFPDLFFMPTGGVDVDRENLREWFKSGVCAVGMGSKLVSKTLLEKRAYSEIKEMTKRVFQTISLARKDL